MRIEELVRDNVKKLAPYSSARDEFWGMEYILLDANENPYDSEINRYPDPYQRALKEQVADLKGIEAQNIFVGNGSDEIIDLLFRCFCEPNKDTVYALSPSYGMYKVSAGINCVDIHYCSLNADFTLGVEELISGIKESDKLLFLCSPNNPTGNTFDTKLIERILETFNGIVVVDEAYIDFSKTESMIEKIDEFPNLVVLQTLSKAWGAAGLRLGLGFMNSEIIHYLNKIKPPYNVNALSQIRAIELIDRFDDYHNTLKELIEQREFLISELKHCASVLKVHPSEANFILAHFSNPQLAYDQLKEAGIIVRDRTRTHLCEGCLRLSVGKQEENIKMIEILKSL